MQRALIVSAHDCSEGGIGVATAEMAIGGRLGAIVDPAAIHPDPTVALFSESTGRIICEVAPEHVDDVIAAIAGATVIGTVVDEPTLTLSGLFALPIDDLVAAFNRSPT